MLVFSFSTAKGANLKKHENGSNTKV